MRRKSLSLLITITILTWAGAAFAVPAYESYKGVTLNDGSTAKLRQRGDEHSHWFEDEKGQAILRTEKGGFEFALKSQSGMLAASGKAYSPKAAAPKGAVRNYTPKKDSPLFKIGHSGSTGITESSQSWFARAAAAIKTAVTGWHSNPVEGKKNLMVVRVNFVNRTFTASEDFYMDKIWKEGKDSLSVRQYYLDQSHQKLQIVSADYDNSTDAPYGLITVSLDKDCFNQGRHPDRLLNTSGSAVTVPEYLQNTVNDHANEVALINDILKKVTETTSADFTKFDTNSDGTITPDELCFYMIISGYEESYSGYINASYPMVWAHAWGPFDPSDYVILQQFGIKIEPASHEVTVEGKKLSKWAMQGELGYKSATESNILPGIGIMAHELGHQLCALPDLYDTSNTNYGMSIYSLMASGSWGHTVPPDTQEIPGSRPVNLDAWSRIYLGWESPSIITAAVEKAVVTFGRALTKSIIRFESPAVDSSTEYLLAEVRDPINDKWDKGIQGYLGGSDKISFKNGALIIQHVDEKSGSGALSRGNDINACTSVPHQGVMVLAAGRNCRDISYTASKGALPEDFWYAGNEKLAEQGDNVGGYFAGKSYFYNGKENTTAMNRSGISLTDFSASGASMTATLCYDAGSGTGTPARAVVPEVDAELKNYVTPLLAQVYNTVKEAAALLGSVNFTEDNLTLDDGCQAILKDETVKSAIPTAAKVFPLPVFTAEVSGKSLNAFSFVVAREQLLAATAQEIRLCKITGNKKALAFTYTELSNPLALKDGNFTVKTMDNIIVSKDSQLSDDYYKVEMFIADNGSYDLDTKLGAILDPAALISETTTPVPTPSSSGGGGGCSAGASVIVLLALLPLAWTAKHGKRKGK